MNHGITQELHEDAAGRKPRPPPAPPRDARPQRSHMPKTTNVTTIAAFHATGATYDTKNRRWLLSTPSAKPTHHQKGGHQNRIRTTRIPAPTATAPTSGRCG
jgi:hypothetical protein